MVVRMKWTSRRSSRWPTRQGTSVQRSRSCTGASPSITVFGSIASRNRFEQRATVLTVSGHSDPGTDVHPAARSPIRRTRAVSDMRTGRYQPASIFSARASGGPTRPRWPRPTSRSMRGRGSREVTPEILVSTDLTCDASETIRVMRTEHSSPNPDEIH